ncbi:hypothetical protein ACFSM5_07325 [Lacibacterium aquatile]|uniref:Enoyl-CoA hydratase n=1 Tax=Lacibacterium aquatile TaxID=1168082 RepID=A0ABW5DS40_9PROT
MIGGHAVSETAKAAGAIGNCLKSLALEAGEHGLQELQALLAVAADIALQEAGDRQEALAAFVSSKPTLVWSR